MAPNNKRRKPKPATESDDRTTELESTEAGSSSGKTYVSAYKCAQQTYERIQGERRQAAEQRKAEKEKREKAIESYLSTKKKMNKALKKHTKKGQPNLGAQMEVILEKIQKRKDMQ